jgi:hypothetical protein
MCTSLQNLSKAFAELESSFFSKGMGKAGNMSLSALQKSAVNPLGQDMESIKTLVSRAQAIARESKAQAQGSS